MIFDAMCMKCKKRQGIELPNSIESQMVVSIAFQESKLNTCSCGGIVDVQVYEGKLDDNRHVID